MNNVGLEFEFLKDEEGNSTYMSSEEFGKLAEKHVYSNIHLLKIIKMNYQNTKLY